MVTILLNYLDIDIPQDNASLKERGLLGAVETTNTKSSNIFNLEQLKRAQMLWISPDEHHFVWDFGANRVRYIRLPQPHRTNLLNYVSLLDLFIDHDYEFLRDVNEDLAI